MSKNNKKAKIINFQNIDSFLQDLRSTNQECTSELFKARNFGNLYVPAQLSKVWGKEVMQRVRIYLKTFYIKGTIKRVWRLITEYESVQEKFQELLKETNSKILLETLTGKFLLNTILSKVFHARLNEYVNRIKDTVLNIQKNKNVKDPLRETLKHYSKQKK